MAKSKYGSAPEKIMKAAEKLFAQKGFEATSVREICLLAGQSNNSAVTIHFGSKEGLILAIRAKRLPEIDARRAVLFNRLNDDERRDLRSLIKCLVYPWLEDIDDEGQRSYAMFVAQMAWVDPGFVPLFDSSAPATSAITQQLRRINGHLPDNEYYIRVRLMLAMFLTIVKHERGMGDWATEDPNFPLFDHVIAMLVAVLQAPAFAGEGSATKGLDGPLDRSLSPPEASSSPGR